uniref:TSC22 domain family protein 1 n=1 Tax=Eptatretus burgeri TaxID=7764 RepID=A0A8C4QNX4_EPTBU
MFEDSPTTPTHREVLGTFLPACLKKSGFQITSVTAAQPSSLAEDTESFDDLDESRTEDISSEILDTSRTTDCEPGPYERSSSEETLNNVETPALTPVHPVHPLGHHPNLLMNGAAMSSTSAPLVPLLAGAGNVTSGNVFPVLSLSQPVIPIAPSATALSSHPPAHSRFRVVKLDAVHEPYCKGRWMCAEFYEKDRVTEAKLFDSHIVEVSSSAAQPSTLQEEVPLFAKINPDFSSPNAHMFSNTVTLQPHQHGNALTTSQPPHPPQSMVSDSTVSQQTPSLEPTSLLPHVMTSSQPHTTVIGVSLPTYTQVAVQPQTHASGASVVAIDNKIEQAMDLVKSHLMYAVREEVEVLKEQIKELIERNSQLEQENHLLKSLASPEQLQQMQTQLPAPAVAPGQPGQLSSTMGAANPTPNIQQGNVESRMHLL